MPVIKEICGYPDDLTTFDFECSFCKCPLTKTVHSSTPKFTQQCHICRVFNEVEVIICPSCRSSKNVIQEDSNRIASVYKCRSKGCNGLTFKEYHDPS